VSTFVVLYAFLWSWSSSVPLPVSPRCSFGGSRFGLEPSTVSSQFLNSFPLEMFFPTHVFQARQPATAHFLYYSILMWLGPA